MNSTVSKEKYFGNIILFENESLVKLPGCNVEPAGSWITWPGWTLPKLCGCTKVVPSCTWNQENGK